MVVNRANSTLQVAHVNHFLSPLQLGREGLNWLVLKKQFCVTALVAIILTSSHGAKPAAKWQPILNEKGIKIYKREVKGNPIRELKGTLVFNASVAEILSVVLDYKKFGEWQKNLIKFERLTTVNSRSFVDYAAFRLPYPVDNRDSVHAVRIHIDEKNKWVHVKLREKKDRRKPKQADFVRIPIARAKWSLKPIRGGKATWVEFTGRGDPGGYIPSWLINWMGKYRMVDTINRLKKRLRQKKFSPVILKEYEFISQWAKK